ncbi:MAG TPA: putative DNA binding domain-containing protein, partial [Chitinophagales bacterium]|nr:putative DNA binding domain-containing protein [Chitinophagales bacterium]
MNKKVQTALEKIEYCIKNNTYEPIETEIIELKPSLPNEKGKEAKSIYQSINAFLNTKGGILIVGLEEPQETNPQKYVLCGYKEKYENPLKAVEKKFTDSRQQVVDIANCIQYEIIDFMGKSLCILYVNELPEETKFVYFNGEARERKITGDSLITESNIAKHEEYKTELKDRRELLPVETATLQDLSIDLVNDYIYEISRKTHLHNPKSDIYAALPFLIQKMFVLKNTEQVSVLGMLVCGQQPDVFLQQRSHVRAFLKTKIHAADDKAEISGNILDLMRHSLAFVLKSIQIAITRDESGKAIAEYPEDLLSECINNALAHRDYKIDDYVRIVIRPDEHIEITNPGHFKEQLILQELDTVIPFRRIIPASKPTNPNLAQVLSVFSKWEGLGNGMAGLVNAALMNKIDLPYYKFNTID